MDMLAIVSKAVFAKAGSLVLGDVYATSVYRSSNKRLEGLAEGGTLYLVTVRPDDVLWLVARMENPTQTKDGWEAKNSTALCDITSAIGSLKLSTGKGISAKPGRLGMSLQTPRILCAEDVLLLDKATRGEECPQAPPEVESAESDVPRSAPPRPAQNAETKKPTLAPTPLDSIIEGDLGRATQGMIRITSESVGTEIDTLVSWLIEDRLWRSFGAKEFYFHLLFNVLLRANEQHLQLLRRPVGPDSRLNIGPLSSQMDIWVSENRERVFQWIGYRLSKNRKASFDDAALPKTKAAIATHIAQRIGSANWNPSKELVEFAKAPRFRLDGEEGLHVLAALLIHGESDDLKKLSQVAQSSPVLAQLLSVRGIEVEKNASTEALFALVFETPDDDDPRWVLSDSLMEQGDPHGEFIRAQLSGEPTKLTTRERKRFAGVLSEHIRWTGAHIIDGPAAHFDRGILHACAIASFDGKSRRDPGWSALEIIDVTKSIERISDYSLPSLRFLGSVQGKEMKVLLQSPVASQLVGLGLKNVLKADREGIWDLVNRLPNLRFLNLGAKAYDESIHSHDVMSRIEYAWTCNSRVDDAKFTSGNWDASWLPEYATLMRRWKSSPTET